jgi:EmrB/QacA subfamily drug resistance transporter
LPTPSPSSYWPTILVVGIGTLLSALAGSSATVALPRIGRVFGLDISTVRWVISVYLVSVTALLPVAGAVADIVGHRGIYLAGFCLFGATSLAGGLAPSFTWLVVARVAQGVGAAMLMATGPALLTTAAPAAKRGRALGTVATCTYIGLTVGPTLGGLLVSKAGWRWVFYINVPVALVVLALGSRFLPPPQKRKLPFDWAGALFLICGLAPALTVISEADRWGLSLWPTITLIVCGAAGLTAFVVTERWRLRHDVSALLDLRLFSNRTFKTAAASAVFNYIALFVPIILLPFYLTEGQGLDAGQAGLLLSAQPLVMAFLASPAGWLSDRIGTRPLATTGMGLMGGGLLLLSTLGPQSAIWTVAAFLALVGAGTGIFISPNSSALMGSAPLHRQGAAGGVLAVSRNLGMLIGVAAATAIFAAAGGQTGRSWQAADFGALQSSLRVAAVVAFGGAIASALGKSPSQKSR